MLSAQAVRNWKLASYALCPIVGFQLVFRTDYNTEQNNGEHIFNGIQSWYNNKIDEMLMGGKDWKRKGLLREIQKEQQQEYKNDNNKSPS